MKKQAIMAVVVSLIALLLVPSISYSKSENNSKGTNDLDVDLSQLNPRELYQLYVEYVDMNNQYLLIMNNLRQIHNSDFPGIDKLDNNFTEHELFEMAQDESYRLFKKWKPREEDSTAFNEALNKYFQNTHSDEIYTLWSKVSK